ncbi:unnamed protein product, partial [Hapterophycus canaliculatus]
MPDMDVSEEAPYQMSGILGERGSTPPTGSGSGVTGVQTSKRPRDESSPVCGKRGRGENGDISLTLKIPMPGAPLQVSSPAGDGGGGGGDGGRRKSYPDTPYPEFVAVCPTSPAYSPSAPAYTPSSPVYSACSGPDSPDSPTCSPNSPPCSPALCESPKINQTPSSPPPFSAAKPSAVTSGGSPAPAATPSDVAADPAVPRRKGRVPHAAPPSLGATDPIFHAALLRVLHGRGGDHCAEAVGWRWKGDAPARFDHWPCALHPSVMDLLACVSASEEEVVMTGCDKKHLGGGGVGGGDDDDDVENPPPPPPPPREAAWRAPRPRTPWANRGGTAAAAASTPSPLPSARPGQTPLSALRKPGSACRLSSKNRVRFSTHDMSVVDTPDPHRGGSERGMISALGGLESILAAAERVRNLAAPGGGGGCGSGGRGGSSASSEPGGQQYEGYFDRFSATVAEPDDDADDGDDGGQAADEREASGPNPIATADSTAAVGEAPGADTPAGSPAAAAAAAAAAATRKGDDADAFLTAEARSVRADLAKFVAVLDEIASSDAAPEEIALEGGWGPEHSNAAVFYAKELALLCGGETRSSGGVAEAAPLATGSGAGVVGSHLRVRYLDVLSCLVRYNLKV